MILYFLSKEIRGGGMGVAAVEINCTFIIYFCHVLGWYFTIRSVTLSKKVYKHFRVFLIKISEILTNLNLKKKKTSKKRGGIDYFCKNSFESCKKNFNKFNIFPTKIKTLIVQCFGFFSSGEEFFHILHEIIHDNI